MQLSYLNSQVYVPCSTPTAQDELHENTPAHEYDLNSILPAPTQTLKTDLVALEPLIPILHAESLFQAFSSPPDKSNSDIWFYPFPKGRPQETKLETLIYMEKQRRRPNVLTFAIMDLKSNELAGIIALGCDPLQATLDIKFLGVKIIPKFRASYVFTHASYLLLSYALNPEAEGGLGVVRVGWRTPPVNIQSQRAAEKLGFSREGIMRCYEVFQDVGESSPYQDTSRVPDGTGRVTEDGVVYSMTCIDWLTGGKRDALKAKISVKKLYDKERVRWMVWRTRKCNGTLTKQIHGWEVVAVGINTPMQS